MSRRVTKFWYLKRKTESVQRFIQKNHNRSSCEENVKCCRDMDRKLWKATFALKTHGTYKKKKKNSFIQSKLLLIIICSYDPSLKADNAQLPLDTEQELLWMDS